MNDGMYTNLRNYLEEIAQTTKRILDLLEKQAAPAQEKKPAATPNTPPVPKDAVGPVTVETVETIDADVVPKKASAKKNKPAAKPGKDGEKFGWNS